MKIDEFDGEGAFFFMKNHLLKSGIEMQQRGRSEKSVIFYFLLDFDHLLWSAMATESDG